MGLIHTITNPAQTHTTMYIVPRFQPKQPILNIIKPWIQDVHLYVRTYFTLQFIPRSKSYNSSGIMIRVRTKSNFLFKS
jgi:hypothetical protein